MRAWWMVTLVATLGACTGEGSTDPKDSSADPPIVDDTDGTDTDDTDVTFETGWGNNSDTADTDESDTDTDLDTDTDAVSTPTPGPDTGRDTAVCPFGEVEDCDGVCYPAYFIGDGTCDDGSNFQSNFDCVEYSFDGGDCDDDTGLPTIDTDEGGCLWVVHITTDDWAAEMSWQIVDANGDVIYEVFSNTYVNDRDYYHTVLLPDGDYEFIKIDTYGDGWNGGRYEIYDELNNNVVASGGLPGGTFGRDAFSIACEEDTDPGTDTDTYTCGELMATMVTQSWGGEVSWEIRERGETTPLVSSPAYLSNQVVNTPITLDSGWYELVMRDAFADGWAGGTLTLTDLAAQGPIFQETLQTGPEDVVEFFIDCSDTFNPVPENPIEPTCVDVRMFLHTSTFGGDVGWEMFNQERGTLIAAAGAGSYLSNRTYEIPLAIGTGSYAVHLTDAFGDGWNGSYMEIIDMESGVEIAQDGRAFTRGSDYWFEFDLACTDDDTDIEPLPDGACAPDAIPDCNGVCWPVAYRGDGFCDDGSTYATNFFCAQTLWDNGDCGPPPTP